MKTITITYSRIKKPYVTPHCEELDCYAVQSVLMGSFIEPSYKTEGSFDGDFNARESGEFFDDDEGDDYDY